jgi:hypothetical protein
VSKPEAQASKHRLNTKPRSTMCTEKIIKFTCEDCKQDIKPGERWPLMTFAKVILCQTLLDKKQKKPEAYAGLSDMWLAYGYEEQQIKYGNGRKKREEDGEGVRDSRCNRCLVRFVEA